ncbi:hypothetical protein P3T76_008386 [Phytophthora citrophthora]|uniref:HTH psq-type domain-containing protein n=1 Tax=Phytophthora citrophthora TaxID=4793 RepID=A0AAD9GKP4_9STRA|nr:hypothetical protein P3T76_008386 [Phytophthora citrophthora]
MDAATTPPSRSPGPPIPRSPDPPPVEPALQVVEATSVEGLVEEVFSSQKKRRRHYSSKQKREVLQASEGLSQRKAASSQGVPRWTLTTWIQCKEDIFAFRGSEKVLSRAPGRPEILPFRVELITFMKDTCRGSHPLTASIMASYVRDEHAEWLEDYLNEKKDAAAAYESLSDDQAHDHCLGRD